MSKLVIIDGNAIMHRAFHALPPLTTKRGELINAVYGLTSMLLRVIQDLKPDSVVVTFDEKEPTFRHKELPTYQAQRPPMASELSSQFDKAKEFLKAAKIPRVIALVVTPYPHSVYGCKWFTTRLLTYRRSASIYFPIRGSHAVAIMGAS